MDVLVRPANMPEFRTSVDQLRADVTSGRAPANVIVSLDGGANWRPAWQAALSPPASSTDEAAKYIIPIGRSSADIYRCSRCCSCRSPSSCSSPSSSGRRRTPSLVPVIGVLCALGIPAQLLTAFLAHRAIRKNPKLLGMGRVIFTYVCTGLLAALSLAIFIVYAAS